uniref:INO80 complex subunit B-like conserved region domain-containing protein n=1 Tax=Glossina brevipalpis TaxID=37001 RepID=A0A1A9X4E4_9MUSC
MPKNEDITMAKKKSKSHKSINKNKNKALDDSFEVEDDHNKSLHSSFNEEENVNIETEEEEKQTLITDTSASTSSSGVPLTNKSEKPCSSKKPVSKRENIQPPHPSVSVKKSRKRRDSGTSSEEERWLTAIEAGKLEEVEDVELKKIKDPKLMTARQRAIYDRNNDNDTTTAGFAESLVALPIGYKEKEKPQTAEEIQKAQLKSQKRKQLADEKREKDKKKTMDRLLKKQESKQRTSNKPKSAKSNQPMIRYRNTLEGAIIQMPIGIEYPLQKQTAKEPPVKKLCAIAGCGQPKVYNCSKTNLPLCSYACYRKNVLSLKDIMC